MLTHAVNYPLLMLYMATVIVVISTPGPVILTVLNTALLNGRANAIQIALGANIASMVLLACAFLIATGLLILNTSSIEWVTVIGSAYLIYCGVTGFCREVKRSQQEPVPTISRRFVHGFLVGLSNPKDILFFVALFPQFYGVTASIKLSLFTLSALWLLLDLLILALLIWLASRGLTKKRQIAQVSNALLILIGCAGLIQSIF